MPLAKRDPQWWLDRPTAIQRIGNRFTIIRDDLLEGGSKTRFLPYLIGDAAELVFGGPFCGGAPLALAVIGKEEGRKVTLWYAKRAKWHRRQILAQSLGAQIMEASPGYMTVVQARAKAYAASAGALFLPLGFDLPEAEAPFVEAMVRVRKKIGSPDQVWAAVGSGMLARCLGRAFPESEIRGVAVGLASRHEGQSMPGNVTIEASAYAFDKETKATAPFPSCGNYDRKAWEICASRSKGSVVFWNVLS